MFYLCGVEDKVRVDPADLGRPAMEAVTSVIEQLYIDKVLDDIGLVVTIYDVLSIEGGFIYHSDGAAHYTVSFRLVVFKPFVNEVLTGKITKCDRDGLHVSLGFFSDILIPEHALKEDHSLIVEEDAKGSTLPPVWIWHFEGNQMYYEGRRPGDPETQPEDLVRFRVKSVKFRKPPSVQELRNRAGVDDMLGTAANPIAVMQIIGAADEDGCGMMSWWEPQDEGAADMGNEQPASVMLA